MLYFMRQITENQRDDVICLQTFKLEQKYDQKKYVLYLRYYLKCILFWNQLIDFLLLSNGHAVNIVRSNLLFYLHQ